MLRGRSFGSSLPMAMVGSWDSIPPSVGDGFDRRGTKRTQESRGEVLESTASGFVTKKHCMWTPKPKYEQRTSEARDHYRQIVLMWFESHHWEYLESKYLNNGERGIDVAKKDLKLLLLEAMSGDKFAKDGQKPNY